jgi:general secretion pathway protein G
MNRSRQTGGRKNRSTLHSQRGLTLIEIIVVLVILTILIAFLTGGLFSQGEKAKAQINGLRMKKLQSSINQYQLMYNAMPSDLQALVSCNETTGSNCVPVTEEETLKDAWGTSFVYSSDGRNYSLKSLGADRREGGSGADGDVILTGP